MSTSSSSSAVCGKKRQSAPADVPRKINPYEQFRTIYRWRNPCAKEKGSVRQALMNAKWKEEFGRGSNVEHLTSYMELTEDEIARQEADKLAGGKRRSKQPKLSTAPQERPHKQLR